METRTLLDHVARNAARKPGAVAYRFLDGSGAEEAVLTFGELAARTAAIAAGLARHARPGDRVLLVADTSPEFVLGFLGVLAAGLVAVPTSQPRLGRTVGRFAAIARSCAPRAVLGGERTLARVRRVLAATDAAAPLAMLPLDGLEAEGAGGVPRVGIDADTLAILQYTSGSTASPRGARILHRNFLANAACIREAMGLGEASESVSWLPLFHDMGLVSGIVGPIVFACPSTLLAPNAFLSRPALWLEAITRLRGTVSGGPNFAYALAAEKVTEEETARLDLSSWEVAFCGAEVVRAGTMRRFVERFAPAGLTPRAMLPVYGLAEATLLVSGGPPGSGLRVLEIERAPGRGMGAGPMPVVGCGAVPGDTTVAIVDPSLGIPLGEGLQGEIWVAGGSVSPGYWEGDAAESGFGSTLPGRDAAFLRTGDIGFLRDGQLFVTGRSKDVIVLRGANLHAEDVEAVADGVHPELRPGGVAAFAIEASEDEGEPEERLALAVELRGREVEGFEAAVERLREEIARQFAVEPFLVVGLRGGALPRTSSGKIRRAAMREMLRTGEVRPLARWQWSG